MSSSNCKENTHNNETNYIVNNMKDMPMTFKSTQSNGKICNVIFQQLLFGDIASSLMHLHCPDHC